MQRGLAGVAIVSMVLAATILIGYVVSEPSTVTVTTYDSLTDLAPIVDAESASEYVEYYPAGNVTGWSGSVALPLTDSATIYVYAPTSSEYEETKYSNMAGAKGVWIPAQDELTSGHFATQRSGVTADYAHGATYPSGYEFMGGVSNNTASAHAGLKTYYSTQYMLLNSSVVSQLYWIDLSNLAQTFTQDMAILADANLQLYADCSDVITQNEVPSGNINIVRYTNGFDVKGTPRAYSGEYLYYQLATGAWYFATYSEDFGFKTYGSALGDGLRLISTTSPNYEWSLLTPTIESARYVLPNTPVTVTGMADWSNGATNAVVKILMSPSLDIYPATAPVIPLEPLGGLGAVPFEMVVLTLDALNNRIYWQGVTNYVGPTQYTLLEYEYTLPGGASIEDLSGLVFNGNGLAYILSTTIATDPNGILWGNPSMDLVHYFPAVMSNGARVQFNGFVVTGQSITIDGHTYTVTDGSITVDGKAHKLAGLAVDYRIDGHTYLVFTQESKAVYDLGASGSKEIAASGTWYYTAELQTINTSIKESNSLVFGGWNMDKSTACLVFVGFLVVGAVGGSYLIPNGLRPLDWIVLVAAGAIALCMM